MESYTVHIRVGDRFEDIVVKALTTAGAIAKARSLSTFKNTELRWARFVV